MPTLYIQVLWCEAGQHEWERVAQKGPRPKSCPEHKGIKSTGYPLPTKAKPKRTKAPVQDRPGANPGILKPKGKKVLSEAHKAAMAEGRRKAAERKRQAKLKEAPELAITEEDRKQIRKAVEPFDESRRSAKKQRKVYQAKEPKALTETQIKKMQDGRIKKKEAQEREQDQALKSLIVHLETQVREAAKEDAKTYKTFVKAKSDKNFDAWMRANTKLMSYLAALKAHRSKLDLESNLATAA